MRAPAEPKFRRRKADRPAEIVQAALAVFAEKGFAAAKLDDIAARAGVSKGALYLYFATKEELFHAVVEQAIAPNMRQIRAAIAGHPGPFPALLQMFAERIVALLADPRLGAVAKMVIGEARNFPALARVWHDDLVSHALGGLAEAVAAAQARGEVRAGDPRAYALQIVSPMIVGVIWRETFAPIGAAPFDLPALARQHVETLTGGLLAEETPR
jgi:AcrR family transcriptional regulator